MTIETSNIHVNWKCAHCSHTRSSNLCPQKKILETQCSTCIFILKLPLSNIMQNLIPYRQPSKTSTFSIFSNKKKIFQTFQHIPTFHVVNPRQKHPPKPCSFWSRSRDQRRGFLVKPHQRKLHTKNCKVNNLLMKHMVKFGVFFFWGGGWKIPMGSPKVKGICCQRGYPWNP